MLVEINEEATGGAGGPGGGGGVFVFFEQEVKITTQPYINFLLFMI